jgi:hypothetical protein
MTSEQPGSLLTGVPAPIPGPVGHVPLERQGSNPMQEGHSLRPPNKEQLQQQQPTHLMRQAPQQPVLEDQELQLHSQLQQQPQQQTAFQCIAAPHLQHEPLATQQQAQQGQKSGIPGVQQTQQQQLMQQRLQHQVLLAQVHTAAVAAAKGADGRSLARQEVGSLCVCARRHLCT